MPKDNPQRPATSASYRPGHSGNPGGRPRGIERTAREALKLREYTADDGKMYTGPDAAIHCLLDIAFDADEATKERLRAIEMVLDRGYGKAKQAIEVSEGAGEKLDMSALTEAQLEALASLPLLEAPDDDSSQPH